jgi:integrase/recombinase XerD
MGFYLSDYTVYLRSEKGLSINTLESYLSDIRQYIDFLQSKNIKDIKYTHNSIVISYMLYLEKNGSAVVSHNIGNPTSVISKKV